MKTFSAMWSDKLGEAIKAANVAPFPMTIKPPKEIQAVISAVNQGIDSHLEACYIPERGDEYELTSRWLRCKISAESLPVLVRRLLESGEDEAMSLASSICTCLEIELV